MIIIFPIDDFLYRLFPVPKNNRELLVDHLRAYYKEGSIEPKIEITDKFITITIDTERQKEDQKAYRQLLYYCEKKQFKQAKLIVGELIQKNPSVSEYHRILGQIHSEEGNQEDAINCLIDALRYDPKNESALIMMGNIFSQFKDDIDTAIAYYDQVLVRKPNDYLALNNIGWNLFLAKKIEEAKKYLRKSIEVKSDFPNSHYATALVAEMEKDYELCFEKAMEAIRCNPNRDDLYKHSIKLAEEAAKKWIENSNLEPIFKEYLETLEKESGIEIRIEEDDSIQTPAKIEYADIHYRDFHLIKYKSLYFAIEHLILHELMHLQLTVEARAKGKNYLYISESSMKNKFFKSMERTQYLLKQNGVAKEAIQNYLMAIYDGINQQVYNTPIDLFIEDRIFQKFKDLRPYQYLSMVSMINEGILATTDPKYTQMIPSELISASKIFNLIMAMHFKDLYGRDFVSDHKPKKQELKLAESMYSEYLQLRTLQPAGMEYTLVESWARTLKLDAYFHLVPESEYKRESKPDVGEEFTDYPSESETKIQEELMQKFLDDHKNKDINSKVSIQMMNALAYFSSLPKSSVKAIAIEFATLGMNGIDPKKEGYSIPSFPNKQFSGYEVLAYYYVSWAIALPEHLSELQMPFDKEYEMAKEFLRIR